MSGSAKAVHYPSVHEGLGKKGRRYLAQEGVTPAGMTELEIGLMTDFDRFCCKSHPEAYEKD